MKIRKIARSLAVIVAVGVAASACSGGGGGDDDDDDDGGIDVDFRMTAISSAPSAFAPAGFAPGFSATRTLNPASYRASSITSGPPDEMHVTLLELAIDNGPGNPGPLLFQGEAELTLTSGAVDLSGVTLLPVPAGHYTRLNATFKRVGQMKGCLTAVFAANTGASGMYAAAGGMGGTNVYTSESMIEGSHTFCTIAAHSQLDVETYSADPIASNAVYEAQSTPELTDVDLVANNDDGSTIAEIEAQSIGIGDDSLDVDLVDGSANTLTMTMDLNRMLRFFANTRNDFNPPNPNMKTGTSYFFTSLFSNQSIQVFPGEPGTIEGYPLDEEICGVGLSCTPDIIGKGWLTLIRNVDGSVHNGTVMPDDDNGASVLKGRVIAAATGTTAGTFNITIDGGAGNEGQLLGFHPQATVGASEDSAVCVPMPVLGYTQNFNVFYHREL